MSIASWLFTRPLAIPLVKFRSVCLGGMGKIYAQNGRIRVKAAETEHPRAIEGINTVLPTKSQQLTLKS